MANTADLGAPGLQDIQLSPRYRVVRRIASGGMATVWCAEDRLLGRHVAVKLLSDIYADDPAAIARFTREARAAARLSGHPHVVTIYDIGEARQPGDSLRRAFIVMGYLAGGTVADALRVREVRRADAVAWLHQAADALDYAHGRGVIHRDIKPANFLLDCERVLHVADFGIARLGAEATITASGYMFGTAAYLAPECALGRPATEASDRYALAVAAYELLVGERPFAASHFAAQARQHVEEPPPAASARNPALPVAVDAVLERGMAKEPGKRWPSAGAFAQALESALAKPSPAPSGLAATIPLPGRAATPEITRHRVPNRRWRSLAVGALAAAALGIGIAAGAHDTSSAPKRAAGTMGTGSHHRAARTGDARRAPTAASTAPTLPGKDAAALEVQGHGLMLAGNYRAALPILRRAVAAADHSGLTYAYALFDLGHSLRLAGDPQAAIPILRKRLQIPNQTATVQAELQAALQAAGRTAPASTTPAPARPASPSSRKNGHGKHKGVGGD